MSTVNLKKLIFSPRINPLLNTNSVPIKKKRVKSNLDSVDLHDTSTGDLIARSVIHQIEEKDDQHFVKVFAAGVAASYDLNRTSSRVFQAILAEYEKAPLSGGYADSIYLAFFDGGLSGRDIDMSEKTFQRGLKDLLEKGFLSPKSPNQFWVNPSLFFKGDRVLFVKEYRRTKRKLSGEEMREKLEENGQHRII